MLKMVDAKLENHNYHNDSRVQSAMFSSCWKVVHQEHSTAIISLDEDWLIEVVLREKLEIIVDEWIKKCETFTRKYRSLKSIADLYRKSCKEVRAAADSTKRLSQEDRKALERHEREKEKALKKADAEYEKLYDCAEAEFPLEKLAEEMGLSPYKVRGECAELPFCIRLETKFEVCSQCQGSGKVANPNIDCCGLTPEDFHDDPDFYDDYMSGRHDQTCPRCGGDRVESIPQFPEWLNKAVQEHDEQEWRHVREVCAERAMGA